MSLKPFKRCFDKIVSPMFLLIEACAAGLCDASWNARGSSATVSSEMNPERSKWGRNKSVFILFKSTKLIYF